MTDAYHLAIHDVPQVLLRHVGGIRLTPSSWNLERAVNVRWTFYRNDQDGAWIRHRGTRLDLPAGRLVLIPGSSLFDSGCATHPWHTYGYFEIAAGPWSTARLPTRPVLTPAIPDELDWEALRGPPDLTQQLLLTSRLSRGLAETLLPVDERNPQDTRLEPALRMIAEDYLRPLSQEDLARACGLTPATFARRYQAATGTTAIQALRQRRVEAAARLLADTEFDLDTIAARCGLTTRPYLTRVFTAVLGITPGAYRAGVRVTTD